MPEKLSVTAKVPENKEKGIKEMVAAINVNVGTTAKELIEMFGDEAVKTNAIANWVVTLQGNIRSGLRRGESPESIQTRLGNAKMGVAAKGVKVDPKQAYLAAFASMTPQEQAAEIKKLTERAANVGK